MQDVYFSVFSHPSRDLGKGSVYFLHHRLFHTSGIKGIPLKKEPPCLAVGELTRGAPQAIWGPLWIPDKTNITNKTRGVS